jgi:hypothetical protein
MQKIFLINQLLPEGNSKLAAALQNSDIASSKVAHIMIDAAAKDSSKDNIRRN